MLGYCHRCQIFLNAGILSPLSVLTEEVPDDQYVHVCLGSSFCIMSRDAIKESLVDIFGSVEVNANLFYNASFSQYAIFKEWISLPKEFYGRILLLLMTNALISHSLWKPDIW